MAGAPVIAGDPRTGAVAGMVLAPLVRKDGLVMELSFMLPWCQITAALLGPPALLDAPAETRRTLVGTVRVLPGPISAIYPAALERGPCSCRWYRCWTAGEIVFLPN